MKAAGARLDPPPSVLGRFASFSAECATPPLPALAEHI